MRKSTIEDLIDLNDNLLKKIAKLEKKIKKLKSENNTLLDAWKKTEEYLTIISKDKGIREIFDEIEKKTKTKMAGEVCPNCMSINTGKEEENGYQILFCTKCDYRNRIDDKRSEQIKED